MDLVEMYALCTFSGNLRRMYNGSPEVILYAQDHTGEFLLDLDWVNSVCKSKIYVKDNITCVEANEWTL